MPNLYLLPKKLPKPLNSFSICPFDISSKMSAGISNLICLKPGLLPEICLGNSLPPLSLIPVASHNPWRHLESSVSLTPTFSGSVHLIGVISIIYWEARPLLTSVFQTSLIFCLNHCRILICPLVFP